MERDSPGSCDVCGSSRPRLNAGKTALSNTLSWNSSLLSTTTHMGPYSKEVGFQEKPADIGLNEADCLLGARSKSSLCNDPIRADAITLQ